eukprot:103484-Prorocentrum_minimum.AAC.1
MGSSTSLALSACNLVTTLSRYSFHLVAGSRGTGLVYVQGGDGPREAQVQGDVQAPDVDAELERVGGGHPPQPSVEQAPFDLTALGHRVPRAVRRQRGEQGGVHRVQHIARVR